MVIHLLNLSNPRFGASETVVRLGDAAHLQSWSLVGDVMGT